MASGWTTTSALSDSLPTILASARSTREFEGVVPNLVDKIALGEGVGTTWNEITYAALTATAVSETTELDNPQQLSDSLISITPTVVGIETFITDRVYTQIAKVGVGQIGKLAQEAIQRKKDEDGIAVFDSATTSLCGAGATLAAGYIRTATKRITSNTTEPGKGTPVCVLHGYQIKDLEDELTAGIGTYNITEGPTARVFAENFSGKIGTASIYEDGNISIDSSDDAKGAVFTKEAIVLVQGRAPRVATVRNEKRGGGGTHVYHYDEYAYGERGAGMWLYEIYSDATAPTS